MIRKSVKLVLLGAVLGSLLTFIPMAIIGGNSKVLTIPVSKTSRATEGDDLFKSCLKRNSIDYALYADVIIIAREDNESAVRHCM